jgi:hypothetical protein
MKTYSSLNQNRFLTHLRTIFCALAIIGMPLVLPSSAADRAGRSIDTPEPVSGDFFPCFSFAGPPRPVGDNLIITFNVTATGTGSLTGTLVGTEIDVVRPDGSITLHGSGLFTGSVNGRSGTLLITYSGRATGGHEILHIAGVRGTDDLAGAHLQGTAEGDVGGQPPPGCDPPSIGGHGTYTGQVIFAP